MRAPTNSKLIAAIGIPLIAGSLLNIAPVTPLSAFVVGGCIALTCIAYHIAHCLEKVNKERQRIELDLLKSDTQRLDLLCEQDEWKKANAQYVTNTIKHEQQKADWASAEMVLKDGINDLIAERAALTEQLQKVTDDSIQAIQSLVGRDKDSQERIAALQQCVHDVELTCAYCNVKQPVLFNIASGEFVCKQCGNTNAIHTNIFTARTSTLLK